MARTPKEEYLKGKSRWAHVTTPNKYGKWAVDLCLDNDSVSKVLQWKKDGIQNVISKDDDGYWVTISRPTTYKTRTGETVGMSPPSVLNSDGTVFTGTRIGNGSDLTVKVELRSFKVPVSGNPGMSMRLAGVRVDNLNPTYVDELDPKQQKQASGFDKIPF